MNNNEVIGLDKASAQDIGRNGKLHRTGCRYPYCHHAEQSWMKLDKVGQRKLLIIIVQLTRELVVY